MTVTTSTITKRDLRKFLRQWEKGKFTKTEIERQLGVVGHRGKWITRQWDSRLGVDTRGVQVSA